MATKDFSSKQEKTIADYLGWGVVSGSGARQFHPGDIKSDTFLGECKTHVEKTNKIVFMKDFWDKIESEASSIMKTPVLFVDDGTQTVKGTWCIFPARIIPSWEDGYDELQLKVLYPKLNCDVNINFDAVYGNKLLKDYATTDFSFMTLIWHNKRFAISPLSNFKRLLEEINN